MTTPQIITLTADVVTEITRSPFLPRNPAQWLSAANVTVHNAVLPGRDARQGNYQRWLGDGAEVTWDETEIVNLANAHDDGAALQVEDTLRVVVKVNGVVLTRVDSVGAPGAGEFTCADAGGMTLVFGDAPADGAVIELFLLGDVNLMDDIDLVAGVPQQARTPQVVFPDGEDCQIIRLTQ